MLVRSLSVLALVLAPVVAHAADVENPYKGAKVGDFAVYKMTTKVGDFNIKGTVTQTVTEKSDKEVTVKGTGTVEFNGNKMDIPAQEQKIDLTKPFDPTKAANLPGGAEAKVEKGKEGKEKIKVGDKEYSTTWTTYTAKMKVMGQEIEADLKTWMAKDVAAGGMVKMTMTAKIAGQDMDILMELTETGNSKK
ncbi:hypothetical protein J8F10_30315 [Gemmata sp. G18]|uniref:DUF5666 domain-containing protein n=1 Tax=Gemmata palustris TaxID=2822762 RepID=A0ABS5C0P0_9BACT|nr:hypothetical protein [Gemmata palustris]MBP3959560.1 hypothetical protein [Gemmata palustris]